MSNLQTPFRYDFVGSFLRPQALKDAKAAYQAGEISKEAFDRVAEEEVAKVVAKQKELGYHVITDGEFRRAFWHLDFMWGFEGVAHEDTGNGVQFDAELALLEDTYLVGKIKAKAHPFVEYFKFLKQFEDENTVAKYTIPAPAQTFQQMIVPANYERTRKIYATNEELIQDIGKAYQDVIQQFYDAGCRNLQFDDCTWGAIVGDAAEQRYQALGIDLNDVKAQLLAVNNLALEGKPADMIINSHICRGNYHSTYFTSGPYDSVADYVFAKENVNALFLEYDDERSGGFAPLAKVSQKIIGMRATIEMQMKRRKVSGVSAARYVKTSFGSAGIRYRMNTTVPKRSVLSRKASLDWRSLEKTRSISGRPNRLTSRNTIVLPMKMPVMQIARPPNGPYVSPAASWMGSAGMTPESTCAI
mgnify:CR=1 FL=1